MVYMVWFGGRIHVGGAKYEESRECGRGPRTMYLACTGHGGEARAVYRAKTARDARRDARRVL